MDSLRCYVILEMRRRFRFDYWPRRRPRVLRRRPAFGVLRPGAAGSVVSQVKLIAEPWDVGGGGYQFSSFPGLWTEWNGSIVHARLLAGEPATLGEFASRLTGSSDLYEGDGPAPERDINFVTCPRCSAQRVFSFNLSANT